MTYLGLMIDENEADDSNEDDTVEFHLGLRLRDRVVFYASFQIPWVLLSIIVYSTGHILRPVPSHTSDRNPFLPRETA